jgi:hypothetical protein
MNEYQNYLNNFIVDRFNNSVLITAPFEYMVIKDILPIEEYNRSLDHATYDRTDLAAAMAPLQSYFYQLFTHVKDPEVKSFNLQLTEWDQGYSYRPHLDGGPRVFSMVIYQPEHDRHPWLGTSVYRKVDNDFRVVDYAPYLPNTGIIFPCGFENWHGNEIQLEAHRRKAMLCFFYNKKLKEAHGWDMEGYTEYE